MSLKNKNGFVRSSVSLSVTIHAVVMGLLLLSPQIKQLPIIKGLITSRTQADMSVESSLGADENITVSYVEPEKNNIKNINSIKENLEIKKITPTKAEEEAIPNIPVNKVGESKVKKMLAKDLAPSKKLAPQDEPLNNKIKRQEPKQDTASNDSPITDQKDTSLDEAIAKDSESPKLFKNPNPPGEIDHTLKESLAAAGLGQGIRDARKLKQLAGNPKPTYPSNARLNKDQGTVVLKYLVTDSGSVEDLRIIESSGSRELDDEAINKIQMWKFKPGQAGETTHPVTFKLNGPSKRLPSRLRTSTSG